MTPSVSGSYVDFTAIWGSAEGNVALTELGLFSAAAAGNMFNRLVSDAINKNAGQLLELTGRITFD